MNGNRIKVSIAEILMLAVSILLAAGCRTFFAVCPAGEHIMACHWAGEALKALSLSIACMNAVHILIPDEKIKLGMDIPIAAVSLLTAFVPGGIIDICQSADMACRSAAAPWTVILCAALVAAVLADMLICASRISRSKHQRKDA